VLHRRVGVPEGDGAGEGARTCPHRMAVIAAAHDPLAVLLADDGADVMAPYHDRTDPRTAGVHAIVSPGSCEIVLRAGILAHLTAHVPAAPGGRPSRMRISIPVVPVMSVMMVMMSSCFCTGSK